MQRRTTFWLAVILLCLAGAGYFVRHGAGPRVPCVGAHPPPAGTNGVADSGQRQQVSSGPAARAAARAERLSHRLTNTRRSLKELQANDRAILLANAFIDTGKPLNLAIPSALRAPANHGTYLVQARGPADEAFRARLREAGATIVFYVPNNAFVVRVSDASAANLAADQRVQAVLAYEPYYKLDAGLLRLAVGARPLPPGAGLNVTVFADALDETLAGLQQLGAEVTGQERSPFGPLLKVRPAPGTLTDLARLPGVQLLGQVHSRASANDLSRATLGVMPDPTVNSNYLGLTGTNILITLADSGVDRSHPDLTNRVFGDQLLSLTDATGHGTHVAGTILGTGVVSATVTNAVGSAPNASFQGMAPHARLYSISLNQSAGPVSPNRILSGLAGDDQAGSVSDTYLQEQAARTNSLISNHSWVYDGTSDYDIAAASYDAAVRDALPATTGPQPAIYVFAAGNGGDGDDGGQGGGPESIASPGTAKNVITVGALEQLRNLTNVFVQGSNGSSQPFLAGSDAPDQVAGFSGRGNVGIDEEGAFGRFKPDVVAPGTFLISDRSGQWDTNSYYFPTNDTISVRPDQAVDAGALQPYSLYVPPNAVGLRITVVTNRLSPRPFPGLQIYARLADNPTTNVFDLLSTNQAVLPGEIPVPLDAPLYYSIANTTTQTVNFDLRVDLLTTNDHPEVTFFLRTNLNDTLGTPPFYRYESGTSMAAAGVSGLLALMQEFFERRLQQTNSPALMKALLINGARSVGQLYDLEVQNQVNAQGWGLPSLSNSAPGCLSNLLTTGSAGLPLQFFDQNPDTALATGQSQTRMLQLTPGGQGQDLRITLVWTDPPGNPAASVKLVNDLDLIVTNLDTGDVFFGNDIPAGSVYTESWDTNGAPNMDRVNNVENVYLAAPLGTNYSVTVMGRRVNVNAVTANTNNVVQDYALVIGSGDGGLLANAFTVAAPAMQATNQPFLQSLTDGVPLLNQRVGANSPYAGVNGVTNQWNFYVYTNTTTFTNVAFVTFLPPELGVTRLGAQESDPNNAVRVEADVDLYVTTNPLLTNLSPVVLQPGAAGLASMSRTRGGTEKVLFTNSVHGRVYYVGVKSEDREGAQFALLGVASPLPFGRRDPNGNVLLTPLSRLPSPIPDGSPSLPGSTNILLITTEPDLARRVVVTNTLSHPRAGDLLNTLSHGQKFVVLKNHTPFDNGLGTETYVYDDSGEGDIPNAHPSDGPGSLRTFVGDNGSDGVWILSLVDDAPTEVGQITSLDITLEPESTTNSVQRTIAGNSFYFDFVDVPPGVTNLVVSVGFTGANAAPAEVFLRRGDFPTLTLFDKSAMISPPGDALSLGQYDSPPLNPGQYFIAVYNPNATPVNVTIVTQLEYDLLPVPVFQFTSRGNEPLLDDAVTYSTNHVNQNSRVVQAEVGVRIDHPRVSDLALTLISPQGTRVLLSENRGGLNSNGYGVGANVTNVVTSTASDTEAGASTTNVIEAGLNYGTVTVGYQFRSAPDVVQVYYQSQLIYDTGLVLGTNAFSVTFGPGFSTEVMIILYEDGVPAGDGDGDWNYTAKVTTTPLVYALFSEDTNYAQVPMKFAVPPFATNAPLTVATPVVFSGFEGIAATNYYFPTNVDGWNLSSNKFTFQPTNSPYVTVVTVPDVAHSGENILNLNSLNLWRLFPTVVGRGYTLSFAYHGKATQYPVSWWRGEQNTLDWADGHYNLGPVGTGPSFNYPLTEVGRGYDISGPIWLRYAGDTPPNYDGNDLTLNLTYTFTIEGWIYPREAGRLQAIISRSDNRVGFVPYRLSVSGNSAGGGANLNFSITDTNRNTASVSAPIPLNQYLHVAAVYSQPDRVMLLYVNGALVGQTRTALVPIGPLNPNAGPGVGVGNAGDLADNQWFNGRLDEMSIYFYILTQADIEDIYASGNAGKCLMTDCTSSGSVVFGTTTNILTLYDGWQTQSYNFTAGSNSVFLQLQPFVPGQNQQLGMQLDTFSLVQNSTPNPKNYFLPEEALTKLVGEPSLGDWKLEVLDNRAGATNPAPKLVSWQLSLILEATGPAVLPLAHGIPQTILVNPGEIRYFSVAVPAAAHYATNILTAGSPVPLLFNQTATPTGTNATDRILLTATAAGTAVLSTNGSFPPLVPGATYYLGVPNTNSAPVAVTLEVYFDAVPLVASQPHMGGVGTNGIDYYEYDVSGNATALAFELLAPSGRADLVARRGPPLPGPGDFDFTSDDPDGDGKTIIIDASSGPQFLAPGRWYLAVINRDTQPVTYAIQATESGPPAIMDLANGAPFTFHSPPGPALTNFFRFVIAQTNAAVLFELYNLSGNADLTVQRDSVPLSPPFVGGSFNAGTAAEQIVIRTNLLGTDLNGKWFLGVVTTTAPLIPDTNPTLNWDAIPGETYQVQYSPDLVNWAVLDTVLAGSAQANYFDFAPGGGGAARFYRIVQVAPPQGGPASDGLR